MRKNIRYFYIYSFIAGLFFLVPIWVAFERKFLSFTEMAMLEVVGTIILVVMQLPTGALADLIGRRNTMILGWLVSFFKPPLPSAL
jgi:MFS family permease